MVATSAAAVAGAYKVDYVIVDTEERITSSVDEFGVQVAGGVVWKIFNGAHCFGSAAGHSEYNIIHSMEDCGVNGTRIVKESTNKALYVQEYFVCEHWRIIIVYKLVADGPRWYRGRDGVVLFGKCMFKFLPSLEDITVHVALEFKADVIPVEINTNVLFGSNINIEGIFRTHDCC